MNVASTFSRKNPVRIVRKALSSRMIFLIRRKMIANLLRLSTDVLGWREGSLEKRKEIKVN